MRVEIWADVVCPWAYIGKRRIERALRGWSGPDGTEVEVVWRPYRIDPTAPTVAEPLAAALQNPFVDTALRACTPTDVTPSENRRRVAEIARDEGIGSRWGARWRVSSHNAHRLVALSLIKAGAGLQNAVMEELLGAHFVEGADIGAIDVLAEVAARAGFDAGGRLLAEGGGEAEVRESLLIGQSRAIRTSPTFVVDGLALAGAQEPEEIRSFLVDAAGREFSEPPEEVERLRRGESLLGAGNPLGALTLLAPLLAEHPEDRAVRLLAARAYYHSAQLNRARNVLEGLIDEGPDDAYAYLLLGRTLQRQGKVGEAGPLLRLAEVMAPGRS